MAAKAGQQIVTPGIDAAKASGISYHIHQYQHQAGSESYGLEAANKLGVEPQRVFKTLVCQLDGKELVVAIIPVTDKLKLKQLAKALKGKKCAMASPNLVQRSSGYVLGGVSPLGQKKSLRTAIDSSANALETIYVSAGKRGLEIELSPADLAQLTNASFHALT